MPHTSPHFGISESHMEKFSLVQLPPRLPTNFHTSIHWCPSDLGELDGNAILNTIKVDIADQSCKKSLLSIVPQQPDFLSRYAQDVHGPNASTVLLHLNHEMAILNIAYSLDIGESPYPRQRGR